MSFFNLFGGKAKEQSFKEDRELNEEKELGAYSGMRVEVTTLEERLLFVAKLMNLREGKGELHQYSEANISKEQEALPVKIRGYSDHEKKAVYMDGTITSMPDHIWKVEELQVTKIENARVFYRLSTDLDATVTTFSGLGAGERPCKLLNISVGGACIGSDKQYHKGDKFLLKVRLLADRPESAMLCQVLRIIEREKAEFEYGCQFLEMTEEDQRAITQNIFVAQRKKRER